MSTFLGMVGGEPLLHMTTDTRTEAQMQGNPGPTTIFHSELPYIFVKKRFTLDSFVYWGSGSGGRTFALPTELQDYKSNNPDLAYLLVVEESDGSKSIINPMLQVDSKYETAENGSLIVNTTSCINGVHYQFAFTTSDSQLSAITRNNSFVKGGVSLTFRPWDVGDTRVTIFQAPYGESWTGSSSLNWTKVHRINDPLGLGSRLPGYDRYGSSSIDLLSQNNDATKLHFIFLNIENSATTFNRLPDKTGTDINIEIDNFDVGGVDMLENTPLIARGVKNSGDTVTSLIANSMLVGSKTTGFSIAACDTGFVDSSGVVSDNNTPVIEIPPAFTSSQTMEIDFKDKTITRDGADIFTAATAQSGLRVIGTKEFSFSMGATVYEFSSGFNNHSITVTGSYTETPDANTTYLASVRYEGLSLLSSTFMAAGDNQIITINAYLNDEVFNPDIFYYFYATALVTISNTGDITARTYWKGFNFSNTSIGNNVTFSLDELDVRLIALSAN